MSQVNFEKRRVLFLCVGNSVRSQMGEGVLRDIGSDAFETFSAGVDPRLVQPAAVTAMRELGIGISVKTRTRQLNERVRIFPLVQRKRFAGR